MLRARKTKPAERFISLLLAIVMTVSGTGLTAFAVEFVPEDTGEPAVTEEAEAAAEPEQSDLRTDVPVDPDLPEDESGEASGAVEPESSDGEASEPAEPESSGEETAEQEIPDADADPAETEASSLPEEPATPDAQPEQPEEPEQPEPKCKPLDLELKADEGITYTFATEDEVISEELMPAARIWEDEEYERYERFTDDLPEDQQIVQAFVIGDGTEAEAPVVFAETAEAFLCCDGWDWSDLTGAEVRDRYTLYLPDTQGDLKPAAFDVLLAEDEDNDRGDAIVFDAEQLSLLVLTETVRVEEEIHDALVEVPASDSEPLLAASELTSLSKSALRSMRAPQRVAPGQQEPVSEDGTTIEKITVRWVSNSTGNSAPAGFDRLVMVPENDRVPNQQFQIDFALSGKDDYEPGTIELIFPAYIWLDRDGKEPGVLTLSVPQDPEHRTEFAWRREGDSIVITNTRRLSAASKVLIQGTYRSMEAHTIRDIDTADQSLPYRGVSDPFYATVNVVTVNENVLTMTSNQIDASLDTHTQVSAATKTAYNTMTNEYYLYYDVPSNLPADLRPENPEDYLYVRWYVSGKAVGNQPYVMTVTDKAENAYGCVMLGADVDGTVTKAENGSVTAVLYSGYSDTVKSGYIWTAYPKSALPENGAVVQLKNTQTVTVTGMDDNVSTTMTADASVPAKSPAVYHFIKKWDDEDDRRGLRPDYLYLKIYDDSASYYYPWRTVRVAPDENGVWSYTWTDEGHPRQFRIQEELVNASGSYGNYYDIYGNRHSMRWNYILKSTDYDAATRTWTYVNQYSEGWIKYDVSGFGKSAEYRYSDSSLKSTRDRALNLLLKGQEAEVLFTASGRIAPALWTVHYGQKPVTVGILDDAFRLNGVRLSTEDVSMSAVQLRAPGVLSYQNYDDTTGFYEGVSVTDPQTVRLYAYRNGRWEQIATMTGREITVTPESGATCVGSRVNLPEGVTQVKTEMETDQAIVDMSMDIILCVKPTQRVLSAIQSAFEESDYVRFDLQNEAEAFCYYNGNKIISMRQPATAFLHGRQYKVAVDLKKSFYYVDNDLVERRLKLHTSAELLLQSNVLDQDVYLEGLAEGDLPNTKSGTFYDLLPIGVQPDTSSIRLNGGDSVRAAYTVENYRNSGRTLLVAQVELSDHISYKYTYSYDSRHSGAFPTEGYRNTHTIDFDSYYSWDDAQKYGLEGLRNTIAYEADEDVLANIQTWAGEPDDPNAGMNILSDEVGVDAALFTGLDGGRTDPAFAYGGAILYVDNVDVRALTSLRKHVTADGSGRWAYGLSGDEVDVQEGGRYTYRLNVQSDTDTWTRDIIIVDSIENYVPPVESDDYGDAQWHGTLLSVDVSQLVASGVAPVIYYSTVPNLDVSYGVDNQPVEAGVIRNHIENDTMNGEKVWSTTPPADLAKVTAIAIDASKRADGSDFILKDNEILMAYIHMIAPSGDATDSIFVGDGKDSAQNAHAYNSAHLSATQITFGVETNAYITNNYTKLGIFTRAFDVTKVWDDENDNDGLRPDAVTVHLFADGEDTGLTLTLDESNEWHGTFDHLKTFNDDGSYIIYTFTEDEVADYTLSIRRAGDKVTLTNRHDLIQTEVPVTKIWRDDNSVADQTRPASITVRLLADGVFTGKTLTLRPDNSGNWSGLFADLNKYTDHGREIIYTLEEIPVTDYRVTYDDAECVIFNNYYPYGDLTVSKTVTGVTPVSAQVDFTFALELTDGEGNELIDRYAYETSDGRTGTLGNGDEFTLKGGETVTIKDIPSHALYKVTELPADGFTLTSAQNTEGVINAHKPAEVSFTNDYAAEGSLELSLTKTLTGRPAMSQYQFRFQVTDEEGNILRTASNKADGSAVFGGIPFTQADHGTEFTYYVSEIDRQKPGYTYDTDAVTVKVTPVDNGDGTMTCTPRFYDADGGELTEIAFQNEYHAEGEITLRAWKSLPGRDLVDGEFSFRLMTPDGTEVETVRNNDKGEIVWTTFHFDENDAGKTFLYIAEELIGTDPTVNYDATLKGYELNVLDNGDGTLSIVQTNVKIAALTESRTCDTCSGTGLVNDEDCPDCENGAVTAVTGYEKAEGDAGLPVFLNTLKPGALSVAKQTAWEAGKEPDQTQQFHFQIRLIGDEVAEDASFSYDLEQVENVGESGSNPTTARSNPTPADRTVSQQGDLSDTVEWIFYSDGELVIQPKDGLTEGSFEGNPYLSEYTYDAQDFWPWSGFRSSIRKVTVKEICSLVGSAGWLFNNCTGLRSIDLSGLVTSNVTDMGEMFKDCSSLTSLDVTGFDTSNVTDMGEMFNGCSSLTSLDVTGFDTGNVTNMYEMFSGCSNLASLDVTGFDTSSATGMSYMFYGCSGLTTLNVTGFDVRNVSDMGGMFHGCSGLSSLDLSMWETDNLLYLHNTFADCSGLTELDLSGWDVGQVEYMFDLFSGCSNLKSLDLSGWNPHESTIFSSMFYGCSSLAYLDLSSFDNRNCYNGWGSFYGMSRMFYGCESLSGIKLGENFSFKANITNSNYYCIFPDAPQEDPYTGLWTCVEHPNLAYTAAELRDNYDGSTMAGTWVWQGAAFTVNFAAPVGAGGSMAVQRIQPGATAALNPNTFYLFDHTFTGWDADGDGVVDYLDGADFTAGEANESVTLTAVFEKNDHTVTLNDGVLDLYLHGGEKATFPDIPAGTAYQVWEETPAGWVLLRQENASGVIEPLQTAEATFLNRYQPGSASAQIIGTKTLDGRAAGEGAYSFQLLDGTRVLQTVTNLSGGFIRFDPITYTVDDVGEHVYTVREVRGTNSAVDYDTHTERVTVTVSGDIENLTATVSYDSDGVKFANRIRPGSIEITKHGEGVTDANADTEFTFRVRLTNPSGLPLGDGESFNWYVKEQQSSPTTARSNPTPADRTVSQSGDLSNTVEWIFYSDGELVIQPKNGLTEGSFDGNSSGYASFWPWYSFVDDITKVKFVSKVKLVGSAAYLFGRSSEGYNLITGLKEIDLSGLDTGEITNMDYMFADCSELTELDVSHFDTSNVTSMYRTFGYCKNLETLDVSGFETGNCTNLGNMFRGCESLKSVDVSNWDTSKVTHFGWMFTYCYSLTELDLSNFDTRNAGNMMRMCSCCTSLTSLDVSGFDASKVTNMWGIFYGDSSLTDLDLSTWTISGETNCDMNWLFMDCTSLQTLDLSSFDSGKGGMASTFENCPSLWKVVLGPKFSFGGRYGATGSGVALPTPPTEYWALDGDPDTALTPEDLASDYNATMSGTWIWLGMDSMYFVSFDANGGYTGAERVTVTADNPTLTLPDEDTTARPDHKLIGWNTKADGTGTAYGVGETVSDLAEYGSSITLYAQWEAGTPNVKYRVRHYQQNTDFETYSLADTDVLRAESGTEQTPAVKTYTGFKAPGAQTVTVAADGATVVEYYYDRTRYTVAFDANTGEGEMDPMDMVGGVGEALSANQFTKQDALFTGWNTRADGTGTAYSDGQTVNSIGADGETVTLYAQWYENPEEVTPSTNGEFTVTVKAGQTVVIPNLPAGTQYEIEEINLPRGWTKTDGSNLTGSVTANIVSAASVTNTYEAKGYASVTAHKALEGGVLTADRFTFELLSSDGTVLGVSSNGPVDTVTETAEDDGSTVTNPWYGTAPVYFDAIEFTQTGVYTYTVRERAGSDETVNYDTHEETVTVTVTDNGDGTLSAEVAYDSDGALFENSMKSGTLTVSKTVKNGTAAALEQTFLFRIDLKDSAGNDLGGAYPVAVTGGTETTLRSGGTVSIKAGETFTVSDLPHGCLYTVTEQDRAGFELTDSTGASGQIDATQAGQTARFENTYFTSGSVTLTAHKTLEGGDIGAEQFRFRLTDADGSELSTAYADTDGTITFQPLDYSQSDDGKTFTYFITEVAGEDETVRYDTHTETVTVKVSDNGAGVMAADVTYSDGAEFTNTRLFHLTVRKTVTGNLGDITQRFPFTLKLTRNGAAYTDAVEAPEGVSWTAGESGAYTFTLSHGDSFTLLLPVDVTYEITETTPEDYNVSISITAADGSERSNVAAAPTAKGTLSQEAGDQTVSFTNTRETAIPTGAGTPALSAILGISGAALAGLAILYGKKRRRKTA